MKITTGGSFLSIFQNEKTPSRSIDIEYNQTLQEPQKVRIKASAQSLKIAFLTSETLFYKLPAARISQINKLQIFIRGSNVISRKS